MLVETQATPFSQQITNGDTINIPAGEVWIVYPTVARFAGNSGEDVFVQVNGNDIFEVRGSAAPYQPDKIVLTGGDSLAIDVDSGATDVYMHASGFKVQDVVDNGGVSHVLGHNDSVTVPTGETWKVSLNFTRFGGNSSESSFVDVNGNTIADKSGSDQAGTWNDIILTEGDTISFRVGSGAGDIHAHIGGFVL